MKYLALVYYEEKTINAMTQAEWQSLNEECVACGEDLRAGGFMVGGNALHPTTTATSVRIRDGKPIITDGPFAETKEQLAGFYLLDARDLNEAIQLASKIPPARLGCVEIRPIRELEPTKDERLQPYSSQIVLHKGFRFMKLSPHFVEYPPLLITGMREPLNEQSAHTIPLLWKKFAPYIGNIKYQIGACIAYGLCVRSSESSNGMYYYMAGCEVSEFGDLPPDLSPLIVPAHKYAVFLHDSHVTTIKDTLDYIFDQWLPNVEFKHNSQSIHFFERYGEGFNPESGLGGMEIWLPLAYQ